MEEQKQELKLILGKMTGKQLAEWFQISYTTYKNKTTKYLKKLENYCSFEKVYGGVEIKEIYNEIYEKKYCHALNEIYLNEVQKNYGLSSVSGIAEKYYISPWQVTKTRNYLFGETTIDIDPEAKGIIGNRRYVWVVKLYPQANDYRGMTLQEQKYFDELIADVYKNITPEEIKRALAIEASYMEQGKTIEQLKEEKKKQGLDFFDRVIGKFRGKYGKTLVHINDHYILSNLEPTDEKDKQERKALLEEYEKGAF